MPRLTAETKTIQEIFQREYVIPAYQRRYSWDKDQCQQLMDDLLLFYDENTETSEQYFLGCLVIAKENDRWAVIDGQQRLTTLSLAIKAIFNKTRENRGVERMLKKVDPISDEIADELRLVSEVWGGDKENFRRVLLGDKNHQLGSQGNKFSENLELIENALNTHSAINSGGDGLSKFIKMLQSRVVLLPIECDSTDGALRIFRTLNDRGLPLNDSDIFKASMYAKLVNKEDKDWFVDSWNELGEGDNSDFGDFVERLFRIHMHVLRAEAKIIGKEGALRDYFDDSHERLAEPRKVIARLQKYQAIFGNWGTADLNIWWHILATTPNIYWQYPLFVFLDKHGEHKDGVFSLTEEKTEEFIALMKDTARYFFIKGVATNSVNTIKDTTFSVCKAIAHDENYADLYSRNAKDDIGSFRLKLEYGSYGRYQKGLVLTNSALCMSSPDDATGYSNILLQEKYNIEHILPRRWSNYDGWNSETYAQCIGKLGNLIPFERRLNIRASNEFFARKQKEYKNSALAEVRGLCNISQWMPEELDKRHNEVISRLLEFFQY